jgi:thioredoxin reductase (NADPH)
MEEKNSKIVLEPRRSFDYSADPNIFYDLIVVGAGVAGLAAAMYGGRLGLKVLVVGNLSGGAVTLTETIENYPGFISIDGGELGRLMENHAKDYDIDILPSSVKSIEICSKNKKKHFLVFSGEKKFCSKSLIVATGTEVRKLGVKGEREFENRGVNYCALCDGPLFRDKIIGVVGGGDSAVKEAILLARYGKKVYIFYREEKLKIERENRLRLEREIENGKIVLIGNTNIVEIKGNSFVKSVILDRPYKGSREFALDGLFIYIGNVPISKLVRDSGVKLNRKGEIMINKNGETSIKGFYAAGDVTDSEWKQAIIGVAEGVKAAFYAYQYVESGKGILPIGESGGKLGKNKKKCENCGSYVSCK